MKKTARRMTLVLLTLCLMAGTTCTAALAESKVIFGKNQVTVDSFQGVPAYYKSGEHATDEVYSCAAYVRRFYKQTYGINVFNLMTGCVPKTDGKGFSFRQVYEGNVKPGDIGYHTNSRGGGHWFIIKSVSGGELIIIEQNWKSGNTGPVDRTVSFRSTPNLKVFRLTKNGADINAGIQGRVSTATLAEMLFDAELYYNLYPDLQQNIGWNPVALKSHWLNHGIAEGRIGSVYLDPAYYLKTHLDVARCYGADNYAAAYEHFLHHGFYEQRQGSPVFSVKYYIGNQSDIKKVYGNDLYQAARHFTVHGIGEQRQGCSTYSVERYGKLNPDVKRVYSTSKEYICHYLQFGRYENRKCL